MLQKTFTKLVIAVFFIYLQSTHILAQRSFSGTIEYALTQRVAQMQEELTQEQQARTDSVEKVMEEKFKAQGKKMITRRSPSVKKYLVAFDNLETRAYWYNNDNVLVNSYYFYQNLNNKILKSQEATLTNWYLVSDTMTTISWKLLKETKKIQNIDCFSAQAEYRGRVWTAWYAPSIPISSGPWKLYGLLGMILEAVDRDGLMQFECTKIDISKEKNIQLNTTDPFLNNKEKNITQKEYVIKLKKSIDNYRKMRADKNQMGGGASINGIEIFEFEKDIISQRIQQKLSDTPKK